ncbi:Hypothetical predicted protein [Paramuricea clavata]|uniref:MADF domain-containing protein n=1 Tax=Paramuricea clavata TaxID=317549 RepID=A0A7D9L7Y1_PARCT|nr:Hypothetical predicted protein [Paramuricea clavata]
MTQEIKSGIADTKYQSKWPLYSCMEFLKEEILKSLKGKEFPKWCDKEIESKDNVKEHPLLWNRQLKEYRDRNKRSQAFEKIATQCIPLGSKSVDDCHTMSDMKVTKNVVQTQIQFLLQHGNFTKA